MRTFQDITDAGDAVNEWYWTHKDDLPEAVASVVRPLLGPTKSAVDLTVKTAEVIYANRAEMDADALALAAGLAALAHVWGYHGLDVDGRGQAMSMALRRDGGESALAGVKWPDAESDPEVDKQFKPEPVLESELVSAEAPE